MEEGIIDLGDLYKMKNKYLISIIVPTKNRTEYALKTIEQILSIDDDSIQLVVQDNSDTNNLKDSITHFCNDSRLKYNYSSELLSFVDNFSLAVSLADGEYICVIGDDDGINPEIVKIARWASENNIDAIKPEVQAVYIWPETGILLHNKKANDGYMRISKISKKIRVCNTKTELKKLLNNGCQKYLTFDVVKLYHGLVKKSCMEEVKKQIGVYFAGLSPDIYSAVALSIVIPEVISIDYPLTISGICKKSGSADSATGKHTGELKDAPHFIGHTGYSWADEVPKFYSVETIWADSSLAAIKDMKQYDLLEEFKLEFLIAYCLKKYSKFSDVIKQQYVDYSSQKKFTRNEAKILLIAAFIEGPCIDIVNRVFSRLTRKKDDFVTLYNVRDIIQAEKELSNYLNNKRLNIEDVIVEIELRLNDTKKTGISKLTT